MSILRRVPHSLIPLLIIPLILIFAQPAQAIDLASIGIRTFTAQGQQIGDINVLITYISGQYPVDPLLITTDPLGPVWYAVPSNEYSVVALDDDFNPIPSTEIIIYPPAGAHDILVNIVMPPTCPADLDFNGNVNTADLLELFSQWGTEGTADLDGSGTVGISDLLILFANWGPCKQ